MNRKDMWQIAKGIKAGCSVAEYAWGLNIVDIESEADVHMLLGLGWRGNKFAMEYRDGLNLHGKDRANPITDEEDRNFSDFINRWNAAYDRLDERTAYEG